MQRVSGTRRHGRSAKARGLPSLGNLPSLGKWRLPASAVLLAAAAGVLSYTFVPNAMVMPVADGLNHGVFSAPALSGLLGQGRGSSVADGQGMPAPVSMATANPSAIRHHPGPKRTHDIAPPGGTAPFLDAAGIGLYDGQSSPASIETAAKWLGSTSSIKYAQDFIDATDFPHIENPWQLSNWQGSPFTMVWAVPMVPCGEPSTQCATDTAAYDQVANGSADGYYKTLAQKLVSAGFGSSYIRIGWEFNADWMGWGVCNSDDSGLSDSASDFVPAFRNIVATMRSVSSSFRFIWNPIDSSNASCPGGNLENFYPGDSYVDNVALDAYDGIGADTTDSARWTAIKNGTNTNGFTAEAPAAINGQKFSGYGLDWLTAFGKAHDKQVGLPEWGLDSTGLDGGGGDDTFFMTQMTQWIKANATGPAIYWNSSGGTLPLNIPNDTSGGTPNATAIFKAAFGT